MSAENKRQPSIQEKKAALREVPDNSKQAEAPSKDKISVSAPSANKVAGTKRPNPSSPSSPLTYTYVRRRLESEQGKVNSAHIIKEETAKKQNVQISQEAQVAQNLQSSPEPQNLQSSKNLENLQSSKKLENLQNESKGNVSDAAKPQDGCKLDAIEATKLQNGSHEEMRKTTNKQNGVVSEAAKQQNVSKGEVSDVTKPQIGIKGEFREATKPQNGNKVDTSEASKLASLTASQDWKARFIRLQAFLKSCDQSNQEDYIRMLRSLSAVGRSKHAIELEKRAIHLLLEEGKELHRMKVLNVLGKGASSDVSLYPSQLSPPSRPQLQR
ncbi:integral membrane hemolysin-III-like protein [Rhynchospora pubera]|uniref:Integral membrane hemolysin-III-like protein n=1 Tax=Rhynchospora pubera TaxID=906938 RepID=A0AAV8CX52_9POAL|nr:integral membrane hemolysin-III-like protein [Rhynchospora pubera]